jgi:hypothetical protein
MTSAVRHGGEHVLDPLLDGVGDGVEVEVFAQHEDRL